MGFLVQNPCETHEKPTLGSEWAQWVNPSKTRTGPSQMGKVESKLKNAPLVAKLKLKTSPDASFTFRMPLIFLKDGLATKNIEQNVKDSCFWALYLAGILKP